MELTSRLSRLNKQMLITPGRAERCVSLGMLLPRDTQHTGLTLTCMTKCHFLGFRPNILHGLSGTAHLSKPPDSQSFDLC